MSRVYLPPFVEHLYLQPSKHTTSQQRRCNVMTLQRRCSDVVRTLCVCWEYTLEPLYKTVHYKALSDILFRSSVRLSLLTITNPNQMMKCYWLCVLRWLLRPMLDLNCLLQIEQERSEEESSVVDALALAFHCAYFCLTSLILFASYSPAALHMRPRHFARSCAICSHDFVGTLKSLREAFRVSSYRFFWSPWERFPNCSSP